jgi:hypothetical protein
MLNGTQHIIANNHFDSCQGIKCLGGKNIIIDSNMMNRSLRHGIKLHNFASNVEGNTNIYNITISNNIILNTVRGYSVGESGGIVIQTAPPSGKVSTYSEIYNGYFNENPKNSIGSVNSIGAHNITISDNQIGQTINSVNATYWYDTYKDYLIDLQYRGTDGPMPYYNSKDTNITPGQIRFINPLIEASIFATPGIRIFNSVNNLKIDNNTFFGGGFNVLPGGSQTFAGQTLTYPYPNFSPVPAIHINNNENHYYRLNNWKITNNNFQDWAAIGGSILEMGCQTGIGPNYGNVEISNNIFDADPYFRFPTRKLENGKQTGAFWQQASDNEKFHDTKTFGMWISNIQAQITVKNNTFKNIHTPMYPRALSEIYEATTSGLFVDNNSIFCEPVIPPSIPADSIPTCVEDDITSGIYFRGVGYIPYSLGTNWNKVIIDGDPESTNYGIIKSFSMVTDAYSESDLSAPPTEKDKFHFYGDFVENRIKGFPINGSFIFGWQKYRTGTDSGYWHCIQSKVSVPNTNILNYTEADIIANKGNILVAGPSGQLTFAGIKDSDLGGHLADTSKHLIASGYLNSLNQLAASGNAGNIVVADPSGYLTFTGIKDSDLSNHFLDTSKHLITNSALKSLNVAALPANANKVVVADSSGYLTFTNIKGTQLNTAISNISTLSSTLSTHINDTSKHLIENGYLNNLNEVAASVNADRIVVGGPSGQLSFSGWKIVWEAGDTGKLVLKN